jgi:hypothetical protein
VARKSQHQDDYRVDEDIRRFEVTVQDALLVCVIEPLSPRVHIAATAGSSASGVDLAVHIPADFLIDSGFRRRQSDHDRSNLREFDRQRR